MLAKIANNLKWMNTQFNFLYFDHSTIPWFEGHSKNILGSFQGPEGPRRLRRPGGSGDENEGFRTECDVCSPTQKGLPRGKPCGMKISPKF